MSKHEERAQGDSVILIVVRNTVLNIHPDYRVSITEIGDSNFDYLTKGIFYVTG